MQRGTEPGLLLDRDGVIVADRGIAHATDLVLLPGVIGALKRARDAGVSMAVVTNQTVVARGLATEAEVAAAHGLLNGSLVAGGVAPLRFFVCPHHPHATDPAYRVVCACRKPLPGMLVDAMAALNLDPARTVLVGDRPSDILAGHRAGCLTVQVHSGRHADAPIVGLDPDEVRPPHHIAADLQAAVAWALDEVWS